MATTEEVARQVLADVATDAGHVLAAQWVQQRYIELCSRVRFRALRRLGEVIIPGTITAGTITLTQGSRIVTGDATAIAAWRAVPITTMVNRSLRLVDNEWHRIESVDPVAGTLTLQTPWTLETVAGSGYYITARQVALDPHARWFGTFMHMRRRVSWTPISLAMLDQLAPERLAMSSAPNICAEFGLDADGAKTFEFYPYPKEDELIHYTFWAVPPELGFSDEIPRTVDAYVLKDGALINAMRYKMSKALDMSPPQVEVAATWRNEYRAQETVWEKKIRDAIRTDRGVDDLSFILQGYGGRSGRGSDIRTAHDEVWNRTSW